MSKDDNFQSLVNGEELDKPLAPFTSWHIGGKAQRFYSPHNLQELAHYLSLLPTSLPWTWLGLGSNVLIRDGGIPGVVIASRQLQALSQLPTGEIRAEAGVSCAKFARFATALGFKQAAFFAGIPGTIGGALAMNAGAFGGETWEWVKVVKVINRQGECYTREPQEFEVDYRSVKGRKDCQQQEAFVEAIFHFPSKVAKDGLLSIRELLRKRADSQPIGTFNCGSVYRNPPGDHAARLIEACGLKGYRLGDAMVSEKHANFIINCKNARAAEIEQLMGIIEQQVEQQFGIQLHAEVKILGSST